MQFNVSESKLSGKWRKMSYFSLAIRSTDSVRRAFQNWFGKIALKSFNSLRYLSMIHLNNISNVWKLVWFYVFVWTNFSRWLFACAFFFTFVLFSLSFSLHYKYIIIWFFRSCFAWFPFVAEFSRLLLFFFLRSVFVLFVLP